MIFSAKNERGEPTWQLVLEGRKTVTRRTRSQPIGAIRAVQQGRGIKACGKIKILSCVLSDEWEDEQGLIKGEICAEACAEAQREGFATWDGLQQWLQKHNKKNLPVYRIEFRLQEE